MFLLSLCVLFVVGVCVERERRVVVLKIDRYID